jgi:hypothetical protein
MKLKGVLIVSVLVNLLLFAGYVTRQKPPSSNEPETKGPAAVVTKTVVKSEVRTNEVLLPPEIVQLDWRSVESADFKKYIENLRAVKCPEETVRDIVIADINKLYAAKWRAFRQPDKEIKYWEPWDSMAEYYDQNLKTKKRELELERKALVMELLGVDYDAESRKYALAFTGSEREEMLMGFLEEGKRAEIMNILTKSRDASRAIYEKAKGGRLTAEDQAELIKVRRTEVEDMKKTMTSQEFEQYVMRVSATANTIRSQMVGFGPTEQEFVAVFRAQTWFNDQFNRKVYNGTPEEIQQRATAQQQLDAMIKQALGDDRFKEYQRGKDYEYRELVRFTQQNELPMQSAATVYEMQRAAQAATAQIRANANLSPEQQQQALAEISTQARAALLKVMDEQALKNYENGRGQWLRQPGGR